MERTIAAEPYRLTVLRDDPAAPILYTVSEAGDARALFASLPTPRPTLVCIEGADWDRDLSPWPAEKVFRGGGDFSGGAEDFLHTLLTKIVPAAEADLSSAWRGLFGYSLAGLFSLWATTKTDAFTRCASVSGSLWFDGFTAYLSCGSTGSRRISPPILLWGSLKRSIYPWGTGRRRRKIPGCSKSGSPRSRRKPSSKARASPAPSS